MINAACRISYRQTVPSCKLTRVASVIAFYTLPPGSRDTTTLWLDAIRIVSQPACEEDAKGLPLVDNSTNEQPPTLNDPWPTQPNAEAFLGKYAELLAKVHEAAVLGGDARFPTILGWPSNEARIGHSPAIACSPANTGVDFFLAVRS